jgi:hypothetical protein
LSADGKALDAGERRKKNEDTFDGGEYSSDDDDKPLSIRAGAKIAPRKRSGEALDADGKALDAGDSDLTNKALSDVRRNVPLKGKNMQVAVY